MKSEKDSIEQALLEGFVTEQEKVQNTEKFLAGLHDQMNATRRLPSNLQSKSSPLFLRSIVGFATLTATLLLVWALIPVKVDTSRSARRPIDSGGAVEPIVARENARLEIQSKISEEDARIGMGLLNSSVSSTMCSVKHANQSLQRIFEPLRGEQSENQAAPTAVPSFERRPMVVSFTDRVLGIGR